MTKKRTMDSNSNRRRVVGVSSTSSSSPSTATTTTTTAAATTKTIPATTTTTTATTKKIAAKTTTATTTTSSPSTVLGTTAGEAVASSANRSVAGRDANPLVASNPPPAAAAVATDDGTGTPRKKAKLTTKPAAAAATTAAATGSAEKLQQNRPKEATRAGLRSRRTDVPLPSTEAGRTPETRFKDAPKTRLQLGARPAGAGSKTGGVAGVAGRGQPIQGSADADAATADGSRKPADGSRKSADGPRRSADAPRRSADGPRRSADAPRRSAAAQVRPATVRCTVEDCRNEMNDTQNRKLFYPIPDIPEIRKTWIDRIRQHNCKSGEVYSNYICVDHFSSDQKLTNGHLRGNAIPNIFIPARRIINCIYCGMTFESRGQLHQHDSAKHLHETRRWKLDCEFESVSPSTLYEGAKTQCEDCEFRVKMRQQMASIRVDLAKASMELANFERTVLTGHLQLKLPLPDDARLCSSDE